MKTLEKIKVMKKEKSVNVIPTQEQLDKTVLNYLESAEKHLYLSRYVGDDKFHCHYKVIPVTIQGKSHYITAEVVNNEIKKITIKDTSWVKTKNHFGMLKNDVFPQYKKQKSVKVCNSEKKIRLDERFNIIKKIVDSNPEMSVEDLKKLIVI